MNVGPAWWFVYKRRNYKRSKEANDPKFRAFHCLDDPYTHYSYWKALFTHFFFIPRFVIGWGLFLFVPIVAVILSIGEGHRNGLLPEWKLHILRRTAKLGCWIAMVACGLVSQKKVQVPADYSKWLGKDYIYTYEGAGMMITNHQY